MDEFDRWPDIIEASQKRGPMGPWAEPGKRLAKEWKHILDIPWMEGTDQYSHEYTFRGSAFSVMKGRLSYGRCKLSAADFRFQLFYGDPVENIRDMTGFSRLYESTDRERVQNANNVIDAGSDGGASIWAVRWHPLCMSIRYPLHSEAGLDLDADRIQAALAVVDWRFAARVANIGRLTEVELKELAAKALQRLPKTDGHTMIYAPSGIAVLLGEKTFGQYQVRAIPELRTDEPRVV